MMPAGHICSRRISSLYGSGHQSVRKIWHSNSAETAGSSRVRSRPEQWRLDAHPKNLHRSSAACLSTNAKPHTTITPPPLSPPAAAAVAAPVVQGKGPLPVPPAPVGVMRESVNKVHISHMNGAESIVSQNANAINITGNLVDVSTRTKPRQNLAQMLDSWRDNARDSGYRGNIVASGNSAEDVESLVNHFTAPALARALREREQTLSLAADLLQSNQIDELKELLHPFLQLPTEHHHMAIRDMVLPPLSDGGVFAPDVLERLAKRLSRLPRYVTSRARKRASVIVPLCLVDGEPSVLFTQRAWNMRRHKGEVCFPGGMVDETDRTIVDAGLRELDEETGISGDQVKIIGILRMDWAFVHSITGVSVTPIIGYLGNFEKLKLTLNPGEVRHCFTVPVSRICDKSLWEMRHLSTPVFSPGGAKGDTKIFGLTAFILERFVRLLPYVSFRGKEHSLLHG